ncbi:serine hydrolase domain-containing protein [Pseudomonas sp. NPDC086278]|uniref:serine hydrolase domain-containing protein n=1 Tax=Pseudomonas sp. NPDC086278 TaxID=3390646 RepID=UPI003D00222E
MLFSLVANGSLTTHDPHGSAVPWWSFTKTVLAGAALTLVRDGLITLDETLPEGPFTLRQLLKHEAGLADYSELADYHAAVARDETPWSANEMLQRLDAATLRYTPGEGWRYSNVGYLFVARLIERVSGQALDAALATRVFSPMGLTRVRLATRRADLVEVNIGAATTYDPRWVYHGLLVGPLDDAVLCLDRLLGGQLLPPSLLAQMQTARVLGGPIAGRPWRAPGYGLGLMQSSVENGLTLSGHTGVGPGSVIAVYRCVEGDRSASCAVFCDRLSEGDVESHVANQLRSAVAL